MHVLIESKSIALVIRINEKGDPLIVYLGRRFSRPDEYQFIPDYNPGDRNCDDTALFNSAFTPSGTRNLLEPAIQVIHADGNPSLELKYVSHQHETLEGVQLTKILLRDPAYPFEVTLFFKVYVDENIFEQWTSIQHQEEGGLVRMQKYASTNLYFNRARRYYLRHFHGNWAQEMTPADVQLTAGLKVLDTKLGTRADLFHAPSFLVSLDRPFDDNDDEDRGEVFAGSLAWSGNYQIQFEIDPLRHLRLLAGINPYASEYFLPANEVFVTPSFLFTYSDEGLNRISQNWHRWARRYRLPQGQNDRLTLLNNWEATYFDFNEEKLKHLIDDGRRLGVDLFLLDDGWFGNKYPRDHDHAGLGDWQVNRRKLPRGLEHLIEHAESTGIRFGLWIEPEMVNPQSELYEQHPDWVIKAPNRTEYYYRNQLVLDLSNPEVQDFVFSLVDRLFTDHPRLAYIKWDCNAVIYNAYSPTHAHQSHLYVDYVRGLYKVLDRLREKYPSIPMMLCSGGGARMDYGALKYFTEFWPSDNTDGLERVFLQWNYSYFFPAIGTCAHVTHWGQQSLKFRTDVAMMGKLGFDLVVSRLTETELLFSQQALTFYNRIKPIIFFGDLFRLVSPFGSNNDVASLIFVNEQQDKAIWFTYLVRSRYRAGRFRTIRLKGLDPKKIYTCEERNVEPGTVIEPKTFSGDYLLKYGFDPKIDIKRPSVVLEFTAKV